MVGSINNGFQQQPPIANTFRPGEQASNTQQEETLAQKLSDLNTNKNVNLTPTSNAAQESAKVSLSTDSARAPNPDNIGSSVNRGNVLDISA